MYGKPWLQADDPLWSQQLLWNIHRDNWLKCFTPREEARKIARKCPLIEEAQWFLATISDGKSMKDAETLEVILAAGKTPRHQAYHGILSCDYNMIRNAAINDDAMAQYRMSKVNTPEGELHWLKKSLDGGYCKAFKRMAIYYRKAFQFEEEKLCLEKGIAAASANLITAYGKSRNLGENHALYLTGRVWLGNANNGKIFLWLVKDWYDNTEDRDIYHGQGFIIGQIVNRLPAEITSKSCFGTPKRCQASTTALDIYLKMSDKTARGIYAWMLVGKSLNIMKDIRMLIAHQIWATRDQAVWA